MGTGRKFSVVWGGDFNTLPNSMAPIATSRDAVKSTIGLDPKRSKKNCPVCNVDHLDTFSRYECPPRAMDILEKQFTHVNTLHPCVNIDQEYITFEQWQNGTCKNRSGVDHVYIMHKCSNNTVMQIPKIHFWHERLGQLGSGHHMLTISLLGVWTCAINRKVKIPKAPFKRLPSWLFEDEKFMLRLHRKASQTLEAMNKPMVSVCRLWDNFYSNINVLAKEHIKTKKKELFKRQRDYGCDISNPKVKMHVNNLESDWEIIDPTPMSNPNGVNDCGIAGVRVSPNLVYTNPESINKHIHYLFS